MAIPLVLYPRFRQLPQLPVGSNGYTLGFRQLPQLPVGSDGYTLIYCIFCVYANELRKTKLLLCQLLRLTRNKQNLS